MGIDPHGAGGLNDAPACAHPPVPIHVKSSASRGERASSRMWRIHAWGPSMIRNRGWLGACLAFAAVGAFAADSPAVPAKHDVPFLGGFLKETRIVYPLRLGDWKATGEHLYDEQDAGVSVRYVNSDDPTGWIDVYLYPAGVLSEEELAHAAGVEREGIRQAHSQAGQHGPDLGALDRFAFTVPSSGGKRDEQHGYSFDLTMDEGGKPFSSAMTLMLERLYFIKGRYSIPADARSRTETRERLQQFMARLLPRLELTSSGECWMPLPIERLQPGQPDPTGALATMGDPKPRHFVMADRVLSRDPGSMEAQVMMTVGMSMQDRLFPGCDGSTPSNPDVSDGMREIRLEYPSPDPGRAPVETPPVPQVDQG